CGAGHFLTEAVEAVNYFRDSDGDNSWARDCIYGIEKDYRLARVAKISLFMNGAGEGNIIFGDGLENNPDKGIDNGVFDILVANPPYSVKDFKQHLQIKNNSFTLLPKIGWNGSEIETLFVERIGQLLKPSGIAAVILPSSILSNDSASYIGAREQILQSFYIRAIVSFGSRTFMAAGTNTVVMFLEKFNEPPRRSALFADSADAIFRNDDLSQWQDSEILDCYLAKIEMDSETYKKFLLRELSLNELNALEYFRMYTNAFAETQAAKKIMSRTFKTPDERTAAYLRKFYEFASEVEHEKILYFALVYQQKTVIINSPADNKGQKEFLGYEWSDKKGFEGMKVIKPGGKLYDNHDRAACGTLASAVRESFGGSAPNINEAQRVYASYVNTMDMLDFSRVKFNKAMRLSVNNPVTFETKYELKVLEDLLMPIVGSTIKVPQDAIKDTGDIPVISQEKETLISGYVDAKEAITDLPLIVFGDHTCVFKYVDFEFVRGADGTQLLKTNANIIKPKYLYYYLQTATITNRDKYERHMKYLKAIKIPLPPISVQQQIVAECEAVDDEYNTTRMSIESYRKKIEEIFTNLDVISLGGGKAI
ncbi:MAG: N-6 DNA methylase, partial [Synergistaceae bacterium]|nr:N-6 DNA methylase [Synergistaceae bacterium]